ncbi:response regulator, partial [Streptococcus suis]
AEEDASTIVAASPRAGEGQATVMVVDDEPTIRMLVTEVLCEMGHNVLEAGDAAAAMRLFATARPSTCSSPTSVCRARSTAASSPTRCWRSGPG